MAANKTTPKGDKPETLRQAHTWTTVKHEYERAGLCGGCAGQAAYGHQLGFHKGLTPPCAEDAGKTLSGELLAKHGPRGQRWLNGEFTRDESA